MYLGTVTEVDYNGTGPTTLHSTYHSIDAAAYMAACIHVVKD
jgi:hypothetical protein